MAKSYHDAVLLLIRRALRELLALVEGSIQPASQNRPAGSTGNTKLVVDYLADSLVSIDVRRFAKDDPRVSSYVYQYQLQPLTELLDPISEFTVSVLVLRHGEVDASGLPKQGFGAVSRASTLVKLLESSAAAEQLRAYGLAYQAASVVRNVSMVVDGVHEARAQVDLTFGVSDPSLVPLYEFTSAEVEGIVQTPDEGSRIYDSTMSTSITGDGDVQVYGPITVDITDEE